jgi:hypothetical protein
MDVFEEDVDDGSMRRRIRLDAVLRDVGPYCSDPEFIRNELGIALSSEDAVGYLKKRIEEIKGIRRGDLRILLNRIMKSK